MKKKLNKGGRPRIPEHLKKKSTTSAIRLPNISLDAIRLVAKAIESGAITSDEVINFINSKGA